MGLEFPQADRVGPNSEEYTQRDLVHLPAATRKKIVCDIAAKLYRLVNGLPPHWGCGDLQIGGGVGIVIG